MNEPAVDLNAQIQAAVMGALGGIDAKLDRVLELERLKRKELLSSAEVEALYGLKSSTLETKRCRGGGPDFVRDGASVYYTHADIKRYLNERRVKGSA